MLSFNELKEPVKPVAEKPATQAADDQTVAVVSLKQPSFRWMDVAVFVVVVAILGLLLVERVPEGFEGNRDDVINNDDKKKDEKDDKKKGDEVQQGDSLVLVAERGDGIAPDVLEVSDLLRTYCESKSFGFRFYDSDMKSSEPHVTFAASKSIKPPFVSVVRSGKPVDVKTIEEIKGLIK